MRRLYCGGSFDFDYLNPDYRIQAAKDYRAVLLGSAELLLEKSDGVRLGEQLEYIGPFYFESEGMVDADIVRCESEMVRRCTDAIFLLDGANCPGTVCELTLASVLGKRVHVFYLRKGEHEETESFLHTPCWYPITFSHMINARTEVHECSSMSDAIGQICAMVEGWRIDLG